jgi:23S rRNA (uracil1939-C5)-methyltransferase
VVEELIEPGARRVDPVCGVFGACGSCAWQHVAYEAQLEAKAEIAQNALSRIGGIDAQSVAITPSRSPYRYRSRSRILVAGGRVGYRRRRSHVVCPTNRCPLLVDPLETELAALAADPPSRDGEWELAWGLDSEGAESSRTVALPTTAADPRLWLPVAGERVSFSAGVFTQSNAGLLDPLAQAVFEGAGEGELALDLFAGAGFLTLGLARRFSRVIAVEANPVAVADLARNAEEAGRAGIRPIAASVERAIFEGALDERPDAIVLDPPRTGLPESVAAWVGNSGAPRVVYLSCDPATLARDLSILCHRGYRVDRVEGFDLFAQTPHLELLTVLDLDRRILPDRDAT